MTQENQISIIIADDHQMVIDGLKSLLVTEPRYRVVAEAVDGQQALDCITQRPDSFQLLLTDVSMPIMGGNELCKKVKYSFPHIQVLILSMYNSVAAVKEAVAAEADGYILKSTGKEELLLALHRITGGGTYFSQGILPIIYQQYQKERKKDEAFAILSVREKEILTLIIKEYTSEEIGEALFISKKTVDNHRQHILTKCGCKTTVGLVKYAIKNGYEME